MRTSTGYRAVRADRMAQARTCWPRPPKLAQHDRLRDGGLRVGDPAADPGRVRLVLAFNQTVAALAPALVGGLARLGRMPKAMVSDTDACNVAHRRCGSVTPVEEVAALYGQLGLKPVPLRARTFRKAKGSSSV